MKKIRVRTNDLLKNSEMLSVRGGKSYGCEKLIKNCKKLKIVCGKVYIKTKSDSVALDSVIPVNIKARKIIITKDNKEQK